MKKITRTLLSTLIVGVSGIALATGGFNADVTSLKHKRQAAHEARLAAPAKARAAAPAKAPVMGGSNGDAQLYGIHVANDMHYSYGYLDGYWGPVAMKTSGNSVTSSDKHTLKASAGCYYNGSYFAVTGIDTDIITYQSYDAETWAPNGNSYGYKVYFDGDDDFVLPTDLAFDPTTNRIYGAFVNKAMKYTGALNSMKLGYINTNSFDVVQTIVELPQKIAALACTKDGQLYGVAFDGNLYKINKETGEMTDPITISYISNYEPDYIFEGMFMSATIDYDTNNLYFNVISRGDYGPEPYLIKVDLSAGTSQVVAKYGYDMSGGDGSQDIFSGIFFKQDVVVESGQPNDVMALYATSVGIEKKALLTFYMPDKDTNGDALESGTTWKAYVGDTEVGSGTAEPDSRVENAEVTVPDYGITLITVKVISKNGTASAGNTTSAFIGCDTPKINRPDVQTSGNEVTVFWDDAESVNGGNMSNVAYKVVRKPDDKVIAESTTETSLIDTFGDNVIVDYYSYVITPMASGNEAGTTLNGESKESLTVFTGGRLDLPWSDSFENNQTFDFYRVIDANKDGNTWVYDSNYKAATYTNNNSTPDDYLLIGPIQMTKGCVYTFSSQVQAHSGTEEVAVYAGTDPASVENYTEFIPTTSVNAILDGVKTVEGEYTAPADGRYYFAVKSVSSSVRVYLKDFKITGVTTDMPAAATFEAEATLTGAKLTIICPDKNIGGESTTPTSLNIYRDGTLIATITDGVAAGNTVIYNDTEAVENGKEGKTVTYGVAAVNAKGEGLRTPRTLFVGLDYPGKPRNLVIWEDLNTPGLIHLTWDAPETGFNGGNCDKDNLTYTFDWMTSSGMMSESDITVDGNEASFTLYTGEAAQDRLAISVWANNSLGTKRSQAWLTSSATTGSPVTLPIIESFAGSRTKYVWSGQATDPNDNWASFGYPSSYAETFSGYDSDGYMEIFGTSKADGGSYRIITPRMTFAGTDKPTFVAYVYATDDVEKFNIEILKNDDRTFSDYYAIPITADRRNKWNQIKLDLNELKDCKYVQFAFYAESNKASNTFAAFDNVSIIDLHDHDLIAVSMTAEADKNVSDDNYLTFTVRNSSDNKVSGSDYEIRLSKNGREIDRIEGSDIQPFTNVTLDYEDVMLSGDGEKANYTAEIIYAADEDLTNNSFAEASTAIAGNDYPTPRNLTATSANGVTLNWTAPDLENRPNASTMDDFESYGNYVIADYGDWVTYDGDGANTITTGMEFFGQVIVFEYDHNGEPFSWMVMNPSQAGIMSSAWESHNGGLKHLVAIRPQNANIQANDWIMSPQLDGSAQTIRFFARAGQYGLNEPLSIYYTDKNSTTPSDYVKLGETLSIPFASEWIEYTAELPAGTLRFALVYEGKGAENYAVLVDDITYIAAGSKPLELNLVNYNIYRDGIMIDTAKPDVLEYIDANVEAGKSYSYNVSALWQRGESPLSNTVTTIASALDALNVNANVSVSSRDMNIIVKGVNNSMVNVYTLTGLNVASRFVDGDASIPVGAKGVYIVTVGNRSFKLVVR